MPEPEKVAELSYVRLLEPHYKRETVDRLTSSENMGGRYHSYTKRKYKLFMTPSALIRNASAEHKHQVTTSFTSTKCCVIFRSVAFCV